MKFVSKYFLLQQFKKFFTDVIKPLFQSEQTARSTADDDLQANIDAETTSRSEAVEAESSARLTADEALKTDIEAETATRETDVTNAKIVSAAIALGIAEKLEANISAEKARAIDAENELFEADNALQSAITAEESARESAVATCMKGECFNATGTTWNAVMTECSKKGGVQAGSCQVGNGWYNFIFIPHRTGVGNDNADFGTMFITEMTSNSGSLWIAHRVTKKNYTPIKIH